MPSITIEHEIPCSEEDFWTKSFFEEDWNRRFYLEVLQFPEWKILELVRSDDGSVRRKVHLRPPTIGLPAPLKKVLGDRFSYTEEGTFDPKTKRYDFRVIPTSMADKTNGRGCISTKPQGKGILRTAHCDLTVKVFMVGSLLEDKILGDFKKSADEAMKFTRIYAKEKGISTE